MKCVLKIVGGVGANLFFFFLNKCWSRTWGEEHLLNFNLLSLCSKVHKYGKSTTGESWDIVVDEETYYEISGEPNINNLDYIFWYCSCCKSNFDLSLYDEGLSRITGGRMSPSVDEPPDEFSPISCGSKNFVCVYAYFCKIPLLLS
ncbi:hypothetical protein D8674_006169 [Pyrus ussuriensis x Pyrus communis]|uniref:Uncharacterized protein n=1 Tax=Pyrus ussuriensis x Pyrus communis TaxID=2448454 RepID=A0A5N5FZ82_9ROSA|nr:hypothetical protein D8674_006169 [Pyrus ussuriensis x Pyrus communis]